MEQNPLLTMLRRDNPILSRVASITSSAIGKASILPSISRSIASPTVL